MYHGCVTSLSDKASISVLVSAECLFFSLRFPWFWQAWFSVETWAFWYYITRLQISFKLVLAAFPGTALLRWVGAPLLTVEVEAQASPGALRTPEGWLLSSLLGSGVGGSLSPRLVSTGAHGGATPQWGGKTPPRQLLCRHWQGPCGPLRCLAEWSSSVCSCSGAPLLTLSLERGGFAGAWRVPGLLVSQLQV